MTDDRAAHDKPHRAFAILAVATAAYSIFSMLLMSDFGQLLALPKSWIIFYYRFKLLFAALNIALLGGLWWMHIRRGVAPRGLMVFATGGVLACLFAANMMNALLFPTRQHEATFVPVEEADQVLTDDQVIYAIELNGEVRGYPQDHMELPHVAGATFGGEEVVMTYCGLSSLPVAITPDIGTEQETDFKVMAQVNNNLILRDVNSGELFQQITATTEFGGASATVYPNTMMTWKSFKQLYPDAEVFIYSFDRLLDPVFRWFFAETLKVQNDREKGAAFPTVSMADQRLNPKERVWGYDGPGGEIAFTREFAAAHPVHPFTFDDEELVLVYDAEHDIVTLFSRMQDGGEVVFDTIDFRGQTDTVRLEQKPLHNGIYWMVWSHWFPGTELNDMN